MPRKDAVQFVEEVSHTGDNWLATGRYEGCVGCGKRGSSMLGVGETIPPPRCPKLNIEEPRLPQPAGRVVR